MNPAPPLAQVPSGAEEALSLAGLLNLLHDGRKTILGAIACALLLGGLYLMVAKPIYEVDALVQVESRKAGKGGEALAAMTSGLFEAATEAQAELEILASALVLGRTAEKLHLDLVARPRWGNPFGAAWLHGKAPEPSLGVETFELPDSLLGKRFRVTAGTGGAFTWAAPDGTFLGQGRVGEKLHAQLEGQNLTLQLRSLDANPGRTFVLKRDPMQLVVENLRKHLTLLERGKQTNIIGLSLEDTNPSRGIRVMETILEQYIYQNIERKAEEASRSLTFLEQQLPILRAKRESDERLISQCRAQLGTVDLDQEAMALVSQTIQGVRDLSQHLRPHQLDELGLAKSVEGMFRRICKSADLPFKATMSAVDGLLGPEAEINLYRIAQESLNNVLKHSGATQVRVALGQAKGQVVLKVRDNGHGFDPASPAGHGGGMGLMIMAERARILGGTVKIQSRPGEGSSLVASVPVSRSLDA